MAQTSAARAGESERRRSREREMRAVRMCEKVYTVSLSASKGVRRSGCVEERAGWFVQGLKRIEESCC